MAIPAYLLGPVVPDLEHPAQPVAGPDPVARPEGLDGPFPVGGTYESALRSTAVAAGAEAVSVRLRVCAEQLCFAAVGPPDHRPARNRDHLRLGRMSDQAGGSGDAGGSGVPEGGGNDADPVGDGAGEARRPVDVVVDVPRARVRLPRATAGEEEPAVPVAGRRDLVGERGPAGFGESARVQAEAVGRLASASQSITLHGGSMPRRARRRPRSVERLGASWVSGEDSTRPGPWTGDGVSGPGK